MFHNFQWGSTWRREYEGRRPSSGRRRGGGGRWQPLEESKVPGLLDDDHQVNLICGILFSYFGNITASGHTCFSYFDAVPFAYSYSDTFLSFLDPRHHLNFAYLHINHHQSQQSQYLHIIVFSAILCQYFSFSSVSTSLTYTTTLTVASLTCTPSSFALSKC